MAFPTDTVYGLGCDPHNPKAISKILRVKGRRGKPLPILVGSPRLAGKQTGANLRVVLRAFRELFRFYGKVKETKR